MMSLNIILVDAQSFALQQFSTEDGLPGTTVYNIIQDKNHYLWILTDGGICTYDGRSFQSVKKIKGQGEIINFHIDSKDRVWMIDLAQKVSCLGNQKTLDFFKSKTPNPTTAIYEDGQQNIWFIHPKSLSAIVEPNGVEKKIQYFNYDHSIQNTGLQSIIAINDNHSISINRKGVSQYKNYKHSFTPFTGNIPNRRFPLFSSPYGDTILVASNNRIFSFTLDNSELVPTFTDINNLLDVGITNFFTDTDENLWITTRDGVLYLQKENNGNLNIIHLLKGVSTNSVFQDAEKNYWIATQREGLFKLSSNKVAIYQNKESGNRIQVVNSFSKNEIIVGYNNNWVSILNEQLQPIHEKKISVSNEEIYDIDVDRKNNTAYIAANFGLFQINNKNYKISKVGTGAGYKSCELGNNGELWAGNYQVVRRYKPEYKRRPLVELRTYALRLGINSELWIGTVEGLYKCINDNCEKITLSDLNLDIRDLAFDDNGTLWIATQSDGVFLFKNGKIIKNLNPPDGLSSNNCHKIIFENNYAWVATNRGISKININDYSIDVITQDNGLPSNEVKDLHYVDDKIYAATNKGLAVFNKDYIVHSQTPHLSISNVQIENHDTTLISEYELPYDKNNIKINFNGVTYKNAESVLYQYKMEGIDDDWVSTNLNVASYPTLSHGKYDFSVRAKALNSEWTEEQHISFIIKKAFWQTWWFYGIFALFSFLLGAKFFQVVIGEVKQRSLIQQNLKDSQLTALRAQMDPHFIFNALNSIQDFIVQEDKRSANHYLSQFSKLMRNILNISDKNKISLKKEVDYLKLYLSLEALRFEETFNYIFEIDENIDLESIYIPSMLIQPFVENSIKHGLMHQNGNKTLIIRFLKEEDHILCEVEDNGIGRQKSREINLRNSKIYKSKALSLTKERIDLLNSADTDKLHLEITDLKDPTGIPSGTKVMIRFF